MKLFCPMGVESASESGKVGECPESLARASPAGCKRWLGGRRLESRGTNPKHSPDTGGLWRSCRSKAGDDGGVGTQDAVLGTRGTGASQSSPAVFSSCKCILTELQKYFHTSDTLQGFHSYVVRSLSLEESKNCCAEAKAQG